MSGKALRAILLANTAIAGLVGQRVRKRRAGQKEDPPYIVHRRVGNRAELHLEGPSTTKVARHQVWCYGKDDEQAEALADLAIEELDGWQGTAAGVRVQACFVDDDSVDFEEDEFADETGDPFVLIEIRMIYERPEP